MDARHGPHHFVVQALNQGHLAFGRSSVLASSVFYYDTLTVPLCNSKLVFRGSCRIEVRLLADHKSGLKFTRRPREHCQNMYSNYFKFV